jgi:hypothetical protein
LGISIRNLQKLVWVIGQKCRQPIHRVPLREMGQRAPDLSGFVVLLNFADDAVAVTALDGCGGSPSGSGAPAQQ